MQQRLGVVVSRRRQVHGPVPVSVGLVMKLVDDEGEVFLRILLRRTTEDEVRVFLTTFAVNITQVGMEEIFLSRV